MKAVAPVCFLLALAHAGAAYSQSVVDKSGATLDKAVLAQLMETVTAEFKDPHGAQFRAIRPTARAGSYCGEVNGKNAFGSYVGFTPFLYREARVIAAPADDPGPGRHEPASAIVLERNMERNRLMLKNMPLSMLDCTTEEGAFIRR